MSVLYRARAIARFSSKRISPQLQTGSLPNARFFTSSPRSLGSQFFAPKRPKPATMDRYTFARAAHRSFGWQPHRFQSTQRMTRIIMGLNVAVFGAWVYADSFKDVKLQKVLMNNFTVSWFNIRANRAWTTITSAFSHSDFTHLLFNMVSFNTFASVLCFAGGVGVGASHIWALTIGSAVVGSVSWLYQKKPVAQRDFGPRSEHGLAAMSNARGASGVVSGFAAAAALLAPMQKMLIFPLPIPIPMWILAGGYVAMDMFYLNKNDNIGRSAHLGGTVFGAVYYLFALRGYGGVARLLRR